MVGQAESPRDPGEDGAGSALVAPAAVGTVGLHGGDFFIEEHCEAHSSGLMVGLRKICSLRCP